MDEMHHNSVDAACSDKLVFAGQAENVNPIALPKLAKGKRGVFSPRNGAPVQPQCLDDSVLLGSPRLAIPQKQRTSLELEDNSENHDPRMVRASAFANGINFLPLEQPLNSSFVCLFAVQIEGIQLKNWVVKLSDSKLYVDGRRV